MPRQIPNEEEHGCTEADTSKQPDRVLTRSGVLRASRARRPATSQDRAAGGGQEAGEQCQGARMRQRKRKHFHGCFSTDHVQEVISTFGETKLLILKKIGLGSLTHLKPAMNHSRALVCWLLKRIDTSRMTLMLDKGDEIELTSKSVHHILGVRCEGDNVAISNNLSEEAKVKIQKIFSTENDESVPTIEDAKGIILADYGEEMSHEEEDRFAVALAAFVCGYMFGPPARSVKVPRNVLEFISTPANLLNCNWASYILSMVQTSASRLQNKLGAETQPHSLLLGGCWLYLELLYLDNIDFGVLNIPLSWFPRVRVYDKHTIQDFISLDEEPKKSGKFGHKERRKPCATDNVPESGWRTSPSGVRMEFASSSGRTCSTLDGKDLSDKIVERFGCIMELVGESKRMAYEEIRNQFEVHENRLRTIFGDLEKKLSEEKKELLLCASTYAAKVSASPGDKAHDGTHESTNDGRVRSVRDGVSVPSLSRFDNVDDNQEVHTKVSAPSSAEKTAEQVVVGVLSAGVAQGTQGIRLRDLVMDTSLEQWDNLLQEEVEQAHQDEGHILNGEADGNGNIMEDRVEGDSTFTAPDDGNGDFMDEHVEGNIGSTDQGRTDIDRGVNEERVGNEQDRLWDWTMAFTMQGGVDGSVPVSQGRFDRTPTNVTSTRSEVHVIGEAADTSPSGGEARYDATPGVTESPISGLLLPGMSLKRQRIKMSGTKNKKKVCSRKRLCAEGLCEGSNSAVGMGQDDLQSAADVQHVVVNEVPRTRHVGERCVQSPPFNMSLRYYQMDNRKIEPKYKCVMKDSGSHLQRYWVILNQPREIKIAGGMLQEEFKKTAHLGRETFCAIVRLLQCQQTWLYNKHAPNRNHWKHYMDPTFAEAAIGNKHFRVTDEIRAMFLGGHLGSKFEHSRLVMVPSNVRGYWCLYVWDTMEHKVHIIDPCSAGVPLGELKRRHEGFVHDLHEALSTCKGEIFTGWNDNFDDYQCIFIKGAYPTTKREGDSGIYVVHFMHWFDGETVVYKIDEKDAFQLRKWLLIDLLNMNENTGEVPTYIKQIVVVDD